MLKPRHASLFPALTPLLPFRLLRTAPLPLLVTVPLAMVPLVALLLGWAAPGRAELLYRLNTRCSLAAASPQPCSVEAVNEGDTTTYQHTIGRRRETIRISDAPLRVVRRQLSTAQWQPVRLISARFSTATICFDGRMLCVVNPNYLNSVRLSNPLQMTGRELVRIHFGRDGRIDASCYDEGCEVSLK